MIPGHVFVGYLADIIDTGRVVDSGRVAFFGY
jgi:hypothetical protein